MVQRGGGIRFTLEMTRRAAVESTRFGLGAVPARRRGLDEVGDEGRSARLRVALSAEGLAALPERPWRRCEP